MNQSDDLKILAEEWFQKAREDELNALSVLKHRDGTPANVCFLAQQMAEKYLKGSLLFYSGDYPKTHDLVQLATLIEKHIPDINKLENNFFSLKPYYIATRYPGDISEEFNWDMAEEAMSLSEEIKEFALERVRK